MPEPSIKTLKNLDLSGRRVLLRADLNVPLDGNRITDDFRLRAILPTLQLLQDKGARTILISHLGRPDGIDPTLSLAPVAARLTELTGKPVQFVPDTIGDTAQVAATALKDGEVLLLENLRFDPREEANDPAFARALADLAEIYVNDAFAAAHRAHASTVGVAAFLPSYPGLLMAEELTMLGRALTEAAPPLLAIVGGAKISTKLALIEHIAARADRLFIGGAMANTFLAAQGHDIGISLAEPDLIPAANRILLQAAAQNCEIILPIDAVIAADPKAQSGTTVPCQSVPGDRAIYDIGPATLLRLRDAIGDAATVIWNGPVGLFENPAFSHGTFELAKLLADRAQDGATVVAGGGDTVAALAQTGLTDRLTYVSTAGGAFLEWLEGHDLPGVKALEQQEKQPS